VRPLQLIKPESIRVFIRKTLSIDIASEDKKESGTYHKLLIKIQKVSGFCPTLMKI